MTWTMTCDELCAVAPEEGKCPEGQERQEVQSTLEEQESIKDIYKNLLRFKMLRNQIWPCVFKDVGHTALFFIVMVRRLCSKYIDRLFFVKMQ